jgi:hypothetical protein
MYEKRMGVKIAGALVTHTGSSVKAGIAGLTTKKRTRKELMEIDYPDYRYAAKLWEREHRDEQPETFHFPSLITMKTKEKIT